MPAESRMVGAALRLQGKVVDSWSKAAFPTSDGIKHVCTDLLTSF